MVWQIRLENYGFFLQLIAYLISGLSMSSFLDLYPGVSSNNLKIWRVNCTLERDKFFSFFHRRYFKGKIWKNCDR